MRLCVALGCLAVLTGCAGPHTSGALWAQQVLERETAMFRLGDAQRAAQGRAFEAGLAEADLAADRARIESGLLDCPGSPRLGLAISPGDRLRDGIRIRVADDAARLSGVAHVALADWWLRRAQQTGEPHFCDQARQALADAGAATPTATAPAGSGRQTQVADLVAGLGRATVSRQPSAAANDAIDATGWSQAASISSYALGYMDAVQASSPLPEYLAAVYGGQLVQRPPVPDLGGQSPESVVDDLAPAHPEWEPDALYEAFRPA